MTEHCRKCLDEFEEYKKKHNEHDKRIALLEDFENWARPILEAVKTIKNDNRWMIIIFTAFVAICTYVYQTDVKQFMTKWSDDKVDIIKEINKFESEMKDKINEVNNQVVTSSKINYKATVREMKEINRDKKD
jgi:tellurite resistance protein